MTGIGKWEEEKTDWFMAAPCMTTVTSNSGATRSPPVEGGIDLLARVGSTTNLVKIGMLLAAFVVYFWNWIHTQHLHSLSSHDWSHAYFVPLISLYLIWQRREELARIKAVTYWPGLAPMLLGLMSYPFFIVGIPNHMGQGYSMILTLFGMVLVLLGPGMMRHLFPPIAYLVFMVTISEMIMIKITFKLKQWAAEGGDVLLQILGVNVQRQGTKLIITNSQGQTNPLDVADACSGMSMLIAFVALGAAVALVGCRFWWQRAVLLILAAPTALLLNVLRIAVLGLLTLWDPDLATGEAHTLIGTLLLVPGFVVYMGIVWALNKAVPETKQNAAGAGKAAA